MDLIESSSVNTIQIEENMLFLDDAAGAGQTWGSLEQRGLH